MLKKIIPSLLLLYIHPVVENNYGKRPACSLEASQKTHLSYIKGGDLIIGGILQTSLMREKTVVHFGDRRRPTEDRCVTPSFSYLRHLLVFMFAIEEINNRSDLLPNVTLGFQIHDTCSREYKALQSAMNILSGLKNAVPNYDCYEKRKVVGFIGHRLTAPSISLATLTGVYHYPQISYGAMDPVFNDEIRFPSFYRTVPDETAQYRAVVLLLQHFGWTWVGIVSSDDENSQRASMGLQRVMSQSRICIEYSIMIKEKCIMSNNLETSHIISHSSSNIVILCGSSDNSRLLKFLRKFPNFWKVFITFGTFQLFQNVEDTIVLNGSLLLHLHRGEIPGLKDYLLNVNLERYPENQILHDFWMSHFDCLPKMLENVSGSGVSPCEEADNLRAVSPSLYDVDNFRYTFSVYSAVYSLAHALHAMYSHRRGQGVEKRAAWQINRYLRKVRFTTTGGEEIRFDKGDTPAKFDLLNVIFLPNKTLVKTKVGHFHDNGGDHRYEIDSNAIQWTPHFVQTPRSVCAESCLPGYQTLRNRREQHCCHHCALCPEGEISNTTDMEKCLKCPEHQWSNVRRDACIERIAEFLSYGEILGASLLSISLLFCCLTAVILGTFIIYRKTVVVRANNQNLSFILLLSLILAFLCPLLFIGYPTEMSCLLRQVAFGNIFTLALSSLLAKTVTVVLAFRATKPDQKLMRWLTKHSSRSLLAICSFGEAVICALWLGLSPPFPDHDTQAEVGKMILQCNEGSVAAFYIVIGYMGGLAALCSFVASLARKLPDTFNEAQYITFSMAVFCSVWVAFIPAYLSSKGKYMVAFEVFAILASSAGLLGCIFIPKCYIILIRPDLNVRANLISSRSRKHFSINPKLKR